MRFIIDTKKRTSKNKSKNSDGKRIGLLILLLLVAIYLIGTVIFSFIALPGTYLNGRDISYASKTEALASAPDDFNLSVTGRDGRELEINPADIDYRAELPKKARIDQNPFIWPATMLTGRKEFYDFEYKIHFNQNKLDRLIADSKLVNGVTQPKDARVIYKDGAFAIEKEVEGNSLDKNMLKTEIINSINTKQNELTLDDSFYKKPAITADSKELKQIVEDSQHIADMKISFNFNGYDFKLEGQEFLDMFDLKKSGFELNYDKVREYVEYLASETNTYGKQRKFNATGIGEIIVNPGVYGFRLDIDGTVDKIYELVNNRTSGDIEPVYDNIAFVRTETGEDIGDTYVELDLSRQHMWYYRDGEVFLESDVVTGIPEDDWASNVGVGSILYKEEDAKLKGLNFDGLTEYETPVDYWMPTGWDGEGFHDASWRSDFGGEIYLTNGSHGCYNLPPEVAKELFENVDYLTPVIVYESSTNYSPPMVY